MIISQVTLLVLSIKEGNSFLVLFIFRLEKRNLLVLLCNYLHDLLGVVKVDDILLMILIRRRVGLKLYLRKGSSDRLSFNLILLRVI